MKSNFNFVKMKKQILSKRKINYQRFFKFIISILIWTHGVGDNVIFANSKILSNENHTLSMQEKKIVQGKVVDKNGEAIPGVSVSLENTTTGTITDMNGNYQLQFNGDQQNKLVFSFIGFENQKVKINNRVNIDIVLIEEITDLNEVIVVGYGVQKKTSVTGSVAMVKSDELLERSSSNTKELLIGKVPGLITQNKGGAPGKNDVSLSIRGFGSPLILIDGREGDFSNLDANDIENVSVLKDASAAIYGARAGNGVILVTTKRGLENKKAEISYHGTISFDQPIVKPNLVNAYKWATLLNEGQKNDGLPQSFTEEDLIKFQEGKEDGYKSYNWYDDLTRDWTPVHQHNLNIRGGNEKVKYYTSFGVLDQSSNFKSGDWDYNRYNLRSNIDIKITKKLKAQIDFEYKNTLVDRANVNLAEMSNDLRVAKPNYPTKLPDSSRAASCGFLQRSPIARTYKKFGGFIENKEDIIFGNLALTYDTPIKGLVIDASFKYKRGFSFDKNVEKPFDVWTYNPNHPNADQDGYILEGQNNDNKLTTSSSQSRMMMPQLKLSYEKNIKNHNLKAIFVAESIEHQSNSLNGFRKGLLSYEAPYLSFANDLEKDNGESAGENGRVSYISRLNYNYKEKYLFESSFRYDASCFFHEDHRWGLFPSFLVAWRLSEEEFIKKITAIDNLKLRASYSQSGDDSQAKEYDHLTGYLINKNKSYLFGYNSHKLINSAGLPNINSTWEKMETYNVGVDLSLWRGCLGLEADIFYRLRDDILTSRKEDVPSTFGATLPLENLNSQSTRGFELALKHRGAINDFNYSASAMISYSRSRWEHYEENDFTDPDNIRLDKKTGQWVDRRYGYVSDGLFKSQEEIDNYSIDQDQAGNKTLSPGDIKYKDISGPNGVPDGIIDWRDRDIIGIGDVPNMMYALNLTGEYKGFSVSMVFQGSSKFDINIGGTAMAPFQNESIPYEHHWKYRSILNEDGTEVINYGDAKLPAISYSGAKGNNTKVSDFWVKDATYLRLKVLNIGYNLPKSLIKNINISNCHIYVSGSNLFTLSKLGIYKNSIDVEGSAGNAGLNYPQQRTITCGIRLSL